MTWTYSQVESWLKRAKIRRIWQNILFYRTFFQLFNGRVDRGKTPRFNFGFKFVEATVCAARKFWAHLPTDEEDLYQWPSFGRRGWCLWQVICYNMFLPVYSTFWCFLNFVWSMTLLLSNHESFFIDNYTYLGLIRMKIFYCSLFWFATTNVPC